MIECWLYPRHSSEHHVACHHSVELHSDLIRKEHFFLLLRFFFNCVLFFLFVLFFSRLKKIFFGV